MDKKDNKKKVIKILNDDQIEFKEGYISSINNVDFPGIYAIFDNNKLIYIGSAYAADRTIEIRLKQYLSRSKTGNTLIKAMRRNKYKNYKYEEDKKISDEEIRIIKGFEYVAFQHKSIEYDLIEDVDDVLNKLGKK